ncbi:MAG: hypothetical protein R2932_30865 [Caldilineaceae bacterium]
MAGAQGGFDTRCACCSIMVTWCGWKIPDIGRRTRRILGAGAGVPVPIDHEGLMVEIGIGAHRRAQLVYVTPSTIPLGVTARSEATVGVAGVGQGSQRLHSRR